MSFVQLHIANISGKPVIQEESDCPAFFHKKRSPTRLWRRDLFTSNLWILESPLHPLFPNYRNHHPFTWSPTTTTKSPQALLVRIYCLSEAHQLWGRILHECGLVCGTPTSPKLLKSPPFRRVQSNPHKQKSTSFITGRLVYKCVPLHGCGLVWVIDQKTSVPTQMHIIPTRLKNM